MSIEMDMTHEQYKMKHEQGHCFERYCITSCSKLMAESMNEYEPQM